MKVLKNFFKILKYSLKTNKAAILISLFVGLLGGIIMFLPLIFGEQILNLVYDAKNFEFIDIFVVALIYVSLTFVASILNLLLNRYFDCIKMFLYQNTDILLAKRNLTLDYEILEKEENKLKLQRARDGQNSSGGVGSFIQNFSSIIQNIFVLALGLFYVSKLFTYDNSIENTNNLMKFANSWYSGLIIIVILILGVIISIFVLKVVYKINEKLFEANVDANHRFLYFFRLSEDYRFGKDARIFNLKEIVFKRMKECNKYLNDSFGKASKKAANITLITTIFTTFVSFISYLFVTLKAYYGIIDIGSIVSVVGSVTNILTALITLVNIIQNMMLQSNYLSNFYDYLTLDNEKIKDEVSIDEVKAPYVFEFKNVSFKYPNSDQYALDNVSFTLGNYDKTAIVGKNGAGKSTIIKLIARFYKPEKGEILVNGININRFNFKDYQKLFAIVFQDFTLFAFSIKENVTANKQIDEELIKKDLDNVNFDYKKFDKGIDTFLYKYLEEGIEVSGGEAQKIAIARALYKDSDYVFLDEPTSALDPISEAEIYSLFDKLVNNKKAIYISHRMSSTKFCDNIIVIDKGKIIECGNHETLMKIHNGVYKELFDSQAKYYK